MAGGGRETYKTRQKAAVLACLTEHADAFLSVDDVTALLHASGETAGRTTVYRALEEAVRTGRASKVAGVRGGAARYRGIDDASASQGQLICLGCGRAFPLDCDMLDAFAEHVSGHHGFSIDRSRTALYGWCERCRAAAEDDAAANGPQGGAR